MPNGLAITPAERAFFASEGTNAARVSGGIGVGFIAWLDAIWEHRAGRGRCTGDVREQGTTPDTMLLS